MIRNDSRSGNRLAFTLVELLVVILIIAILVSLLSSAVLKAMQKIPEVQTRTEITQLEVALQAFMSDYNLTEPPPSLLVLNELSPLTSPSAGFLQSVFGKNLGAPVGNAPPGVDWDGNGLIGGVWTLQGHQSLVFYLGGIPSATAGPQGFSTNNMKPSMGSMPQDYQPLNPAGLPPGVGMGKRKGPYFNFVTSRLVPPPKEAQASAPPFPVYIDPWQSKTGAFFTHQTVVPPGVTLGGTPYAYFSSYGKNNGYNVTDCNQLIYPDLLGNHFAMPYWTAATGSQLTFTNSNKYQIISAGKDGMFGYNPNFPQPCNLWSPAGGATGTGADDQANFSGSLLGSGQS